ncbi:CbrC family protein [Metabacillus bambusae]|uniref:CbrC family protein n=1 Tax=Metabacillus bambusae TaxID=2795218 RepID=A0ABS3MYB3_9BACI|nr:CbrC family protein [Metabacillus bambusae]MBO1511006.1 CbrC family protein [Metabacillus bambusae]
MSYTLILEIDLVELNNNQKGTFLSEVSKYISTQDFESFRRSVSNSTEVYHVLDTEYNKIINIRKIIKRLNDYTTKFTIYQETEDKKITITLLDLENIIDEFKVIHQLPYFKYHPNVYESGSISYYKDICEVCNQESSFFNEGSYGESDLEVICVHCIASGKAGKEHDVFFNYQYPISFKDDNKVAELHLRTPSIPSWQEISWLEHCNDFCAYIGIVDWEGVRHLEPELQSDLTIEASKYNLQQSDLKNALNSYIVGHLYKCLHCGKYRLTTDLP